MPFGKLRTYRSQQKSTADSQAIDQMLIPLGKCTQAEQVNLRPLKLQN